LYYNGGIICDVLTNRIRKTLHAVVLEEAAGGDGDNRIPRHTIYLYPVFQTTEQLTKTVLTHGAMRHSIFSRSIFIQAILSVQAVLMTML
jgi:hypothetical protein